MTMTTDIPVRSRTTTKQKVGLVLCMLNSLLSVPSFLEGNPDPGGDGPPQAVLILASVLGVIGVVATVLAWRGSRVALRVAAGTIIVNTLTSLPAFFVDVPLWLKGLVGFGVVLCVVTVVLMFSDDRRPAPVTD
jgi:Na+/melibiose symporter-like transporter